MIWYNRYCRPSGYPTNIRFAQHLKDLGKTVQEYFGVTTEIAGAFADSLYAKYYTAELGLEEPDIFDLKMQAIFHQHISFFTSLFEARRNVIENASQGVESVRQTDTNGSTRYGRTTTDSAVKDNTTITYGHKINDKSINDKTNSQSVEYVNVGETEQSRDYEYDHTNSGQDTTAKEYEYTHKNGGTDYNQGGATETYTRKGSPAFYNALVEASAADIFEKFNELFKGLFMEVID